MGNEGAFIANDFDNLSTFRDDQHFRSRESVGNIFDSSTGFFGDNSVFDTTVGKNVDIQSSQLERLKSLVKPQSEICPSNRRPLRSFKMGGHQCFTINRKNQPTMFATCRKRECPECSQHKGVGRCMEDFEEASVFAWCDDDNGTGDRIREVSLLLACLSVVTALCVAAALAEYGTNINSYGSGARDQSRSVYQDSSFGRNQGKSSKSLRDLNSFNGAQNRQAQSGRNYNGRANQFGQKSAKAAENGNRAAQNFAKQDAKYDEVARQIADAGYSQGYQSAAQGKYDKLDDNRARGFNGAAANKKAYNRGKVFNDNISYGFDKKFDQDLSERGGFEEENGHNAHKLDEYRDKQKARKLLRGDHSAANARQDAQHALKESKYSQNAAQKQAANGKYGNSDKKLDKAGASQDAQAVQYDRKDSKFHAEDAGRQQAVKKANDFANKDNAFGRRAAASQAGAQGHADKKYYAGHGNNGHHGGITGGTGYGNTGVHGSTSGTGTHGEGSGGNTNHKYGANAKQVDQGREHLAQAAGATDAALKEYKQASNKGQFAQLKSLHDQRNGKFAQGVHDAQNNGFNAKNSQAAKTASGDDKKYADAAAQSNAKAAKHDLDEAAFDKENFKRNQQDRNENFKKLKRFYHDKKSGGNNLERLSYNRKRVENEFGETQAAQKEHQNQYDKAHKSAKHNQAQRKDNFQDAKKASNGFSLHKANRLSHGNSYNQATGFSKAAQQASGNKKDIAEADFANNRDALSKQQKTLDDHAVRSAAATSNGYKNAAASQGVKLGTGTGISGNLITNGAHRTPRTGFHSAISPVVVNDVHGSGTHSSHRPSSSFIGNTNHFDNDFGGYRDDHNRGRSLGSVGTVSSEYGNYGGHNDNFGSSFGGFSGGFGDFGSFDHNKGSSFGGSYASNSDGRSHRGSGLGLFGSGFSSFRGSGSLGSFGATPQFGFRRSAKGGLY
ncbi:keratin, type II cytoskeletal 2 epidermal-like [Haliotis asinina]|uniref:keratin, type II cytoskeletal 2 epidermal-like n=1 Tax=Haliotis asinina TaxID=109174 RepID=UPI003531CC45